jgi:hypothetical protein
MGDITAGLSTDMRQDETHTSQTGLTVTSGRDQRESGNFMNYVMAMAVCKEFFVLAFWWGMWVDWTARIGELSFIIDMLDGLFL